MYVPGANMGLSYGWLAIVAVAANERKAIPSRRIGVMRAALKTF